MCSVPNVMAEAMGTVQKPSKKITRNRNSSWIEAHCNGIIQLHNLTLLQTKQIQKHLWKTLYGIFSFQSFSYPTATTIITESTVVFAFYEPLFYICTVSWNCMKQISSEVPLILYSCGKLLISVKQIIWFATISTSHDDYTECSINSEAF
jgi:hypothetical protein